MSENNCFEKVYEGAKLKIFFTKGLNNELTLWIESYDEFPQIVAGKEMCKDGYFLKGHEVEDLIKFLQKSLEENNYGEDESEY